MKKWLILCMAMVLSLALLAGCDSADPNNPYGQGPLLPPTRSRRTRAPLPFLSSLKCKEKQNRPGALVAAGAVLRLASYEKRTLRVTGAGESILIHDDAVAAVVALVDHGEGAALILVAEGKEGVAQHLHLGDGLVHVHGTEEEALGAHQLVAGLLVCVHVRDEKGVVGLVKGPFPQTLLQAGFVLAR